MTNSLPLSVSVIVPTYKRPDLLKRCLAALLHQSISGDTYEIIVCDDGPSSVVAELLQQLAAHQGNNRPLMRYIAVTATQGPAAARNAGWHIARAPIIAFTDDDTIADPGWLSAGLSAMASGAHAAVGAIIMPLPEKLTDYEKDAGRLQQAEFATANCFVRRDALEMVGGFDERYTQAWREDSDLHFSLLKNGCLIIRAPNAIVMHPLRPARFAAGLAMQKKVMFDVLLYRKHRHLYRERIRKGPPWLYLLVTASLIVAFFAFLSGWAAAAKVALYIWVALSLGFFIYRLARTSFALRNIAELLVTSVLIPPLSIFWRVVGAARFGRGLP
ncbi:MAG TPA: glycosyltransferase [Eoetvoesiella sp.]